MKFHQAMVEFHGAWTTPRVRDKKNALLATIVARV
jgi:hypothetical protein